MTDNNQQGQYSGGFAFAGQGQAQPVPPVPPAQAAQPVQPIYQVPAPVPAAYAAPVPATQATGGGVVAGGGAKPPVTDPNHDPNYVFGSRMQSFTTTVVLPAHQLKFDERQFINLLAGSISLTKDEKKKIIDSLPKLRQAQVDELIRIFDEERTKFVELSKKHGSQLKKLEDEHHADWRDIEMIYKQETQSGEDTAQADAIRKQLGL
jgi:hypothetical protein